MAASTKVVMKQDYWDKKPSSFADTVQLVENYVRQEIIREVRVKQLYYHNLDHALAVKRRANYIFQKIEPILSQNKSLAEIKRLACLIDLCGFAHDMVQIFEPNTSSCQPRKRRAGLSETATANKLLRFIQKLNRQLAACQIDPSFTFSDRDRKIIRDGILATICTRDPQAGQANYSFSPYSIYQPYLYEFSPKASIVGKIIALADLGALGIDGVESYIKDGILVFLEDNPDIEGTISTYNSSGCQNFDCYYGDGSSAIASKILTMTRFMVSLARERKARFELEISGFEEPIRQILREQVFIHLTQKNMQKIEAMIPTQDDANLAQLIDFLSLDKYLN